MSDQIISCPSCDCRMQIALDGVARKWACGKCKQQFEMVGETPILVAATTPIPSSPISIVAAPTSPTARVSKKGNGKFVALAVASVAALILTAFGVHTLIGGPEKNTVVVAEKKTRAMELERPPSADSIREEAPDLPESEVMQAADAIRAHSVKSLPMRGDEASPAESSEPVIPKRETPKRKMETPRRTTKTPTRRKTPKDVEGILARLPDAESREQSRLLGQLSKIPVVPEHRQRVIDALRPFLGGAFHTESLATAAVLHWGNEDHRELFWEMARCDSPNFYEPLSRLQQMDDPGVFKQLIKNQRDSLKGPMSHRLLSNIGLEAEEMVVKAFKASDDRTLRNNALMYLVKHGTEKSLPFLKSLQEGEYAGAAMMATSRIESKEGLVTSHKKEVARKQREVRQALGIPEPERLDVEAILSQMANGQDVMANLGRLRDIDDEVTDKQQDRIIAAVTPFLGDEKKSHRAARVLFRFGQSRHKDAFRKAASIPGGSYGGKAVRMLGEMDDPDVVPILVELLKDRQVEFQVMSILSKRGSEVEQPLIDVYDDLLNSTKLNVVLFLGDSGTKKSVPLLKSVAKSGQGSIIRKAAEKSLRKIESR